ncbi:MAG TPA: hypothetical protein VL576_02795 [Candidatus Paceibacterota bacterium]|jgi:hypothetical protein|nr:hypothetical protein [Candidatus Paceibacterota bacterium]
MKKIIGKLTLATILIGALVVGFLGLIVYNIKDMVFGAPLTVHTIADGSTINNDYVAITGSAKHAQSITINGMAVGVDRQGNFSDGVILSPGYNIVEVAETDRFGKTKNYAYHWVDAPSVSVAQNDVTPYQR